MPEPSPLLFPLIAQLRARREQLGLSQDDLDERAGFTEKQVAKWERGFRQPSAFMLAIWANALGLAVVTVEEATLRSELRASMDEYSQARQSEIATMNCTRRKKRGRSRSSSVTRSTTSSMTADLFSLASGASATPPISATGILTAA
jgi:transcriptional regulator with XRE-family HTH domain